MAIAFDAVSSGALAASGTAVSHTCTGTNLILVVFTYQAAAADTVTGVTYNAVSMTRVDTSTRSDTGDYTISSWYLINPATGAHNIVASTSSGTVGITAASYTGAKQSAQPDSHATASTASGTTSITGTTTIVAANSWQVFGMGDSGSNPAAGTGATQRVSGTPGATGLFDSNGGLAAGSQSIQATWTGASTSGNGCVVAIAPVAAAVNSNMLMFF